MMFGKHTLFVTLLLVSTASFAQAGQQELSDTAQVHFKQSYAIYEPSFMNNDARISNLVEKLRPSDAIDSLYRLKIKGITVVGSASPEGSIAFNKSLSQHRADTLLSHVAKVLDYPLDEASTLGIGRNWDGLLALVKSDANVPYREDVISLLENITASTSATRESLRSGNLLRLKQLRGGVPYAYLYKNLFPTLRSATVTIDYDLYNRLPALSQAVPSLSEGVVPELILANATYPQKSRPFYMALKTNMLFDALAIPNIGAEFYLGKNISIAGNWAYGWWDKDNRHDYWRYYGGDLALRWWSGSAAEKKPLTGHHIGVFGGVFTYDFELGGKGYMGGKPGSPLWDRCMTTAGFEYGYSLPITRRLNIDFTIGFGYIGGKYIKYEPYGTGYRWLSTHRLRWFGPAKAEISLTWLIGADNFNSGKGGKR